MPARPTNHRTCYFFHDQPGPARPVNTHKVGRLNTHEMIIEQVSLTVSCPTLLQVDPSTTITRECVFSDRMLEKIFGLPVM